MRRRDLGSHHTACPGQHPTLSTDELAGLSLYIKLHLSSWGDGTTVSPGKPLLDRASNHKACPSLDHSVTLSFDDITTMDAQFAFIALASTSKAAREKWTDCSRSTPV